MEQFYIKRLKIILCGFTGLLIVLYIAYRNVTLPKRLYTLYSDTIKNKRESLTVSIPKYIENLELKDFINEYPYYKFNIESIQETKKLSKTQINIDYKIDYYLSQEQSKEVNNKIQEIAKELFKEKDKITEYEKAYIIYNYILDNYKLDNKYKTSYDAIKYNKTSNIGYTDLFNRLAKAAGIRSIIIFGELTTNEGTQEHTWNAVNIEDNWYHVDLSMSNYKGDMRYVYFLVPYYQIYNTHTINPVYPPSETSLTEVVKDKRLLSKLKKDCIDYKIYSVKSPKELLNIIKRSKNNKKTVIRIYYEEVIHLKELNKFLKINKCQQIVQISNPIKFTINNETKYLYTLEIGKS